MPKYAFECENSDCGLHFEQILKIGNHPSTPCPSCGDEAPRVIAGEGFAFGFDVKPEARGNSGVTKEDFPTADHAVGRSAEERWEHYDQRKQVKEKVREVGQSIPLARVDGVDESGHRYIEYESLTTQGKNVRKNRAKNALNALARAKTQKASG
jgi:putative FmdB family regulatory protein